MATREKAKWLVKLLKVIVVVYLLLILYQLIGNVYSRLSNTHEIQVPEEWNLIVVNRWNELPEDYEVELTELSNGQMVDSRIYPYLQEMFDAARTCAIRKSDMIAFLQENSVYSLKDGIGECEATVQIYVGEKEKQPMKKSAKIIHEKLQDSFIQVLPNMYHGEFSINHADDYVRKLLEIVK